MLRKIFRKLIAVPGMVAQLAHWFFDPKNGANFVTPFKRHFLPTSTSFVVTILYNTVSGLCNFFVSYVLGSIAHLVQVIAGIALDLWRANPSYTRWILGLVASLVIILTKSAISIVKIVYSTTTSLIRSMR